MLQSTAAVTCKHMLRVCQYASNALSLIRAAALHTLPRTAPKRTKNARNRAQGCQDRVSCWRTLVL